MDRQSSDFVDNLWPKGLHNVVTNKRSAVVLVTNDVALLELVPSPLLLVVVMLLLSHLLVFLFASAFAKCGAFHAWLSSCHLELFLEMLIPIFVVLHLVLLQYMHLGVFFALLLLLAFQGVINSLT